VLRPAVSDPAVVRQLPATERRQTVTYLNGFGQPMQQIGVQAGPAQEDVVQHIGFLGTSTTVQTYLPVPEATASKASGAFEADPVSKITAYYANKGGQAYSTATAEASPWSRPLEQTQTGTAWAGHASHRSYAANAASEVRRWQGFDGRQFYDAGQLAKEISLDPDNRRTEVFTDQLGRVVLQRKVDGTQQFDTYTVYADAGYVQAVIPPAAVQALASSGQWNVQDAGFIDRWLYQYTYDDRGRVVKRKFPGAEPVYLVYDPFDRPILVQDGAHRAAAGGQWLFTKFDAQNRPVVEGLWQDGRSRTAVQAAADQFAQTQAAEFESRNATGYTTTNTFPSVTEGNNGTLLSITFYDDYDLNNDGTRDYDYQVESRVSAAERPVPTYQTRGLTTVTRRRVVSPNGQYGGWLTTALFYDQYGNVVQKQSNNLLQVNPSTSPLSDVTTLVYREQGFVPQVLRSVKKQEYGAGTPAVVRNRFAYDPAGRLLQTWQQHEWKGTIEPEVLLSRNRYTGLGELTQKKLHSRDQGARFLQYEDFAYNLHGQLTAINNSATLLAQNPDNDLFALEIAREQDAGGGGNTPRYDGGISAVSWTTHNAAQTKQPERQRRYLFAYDGLGRLKDATYAARPAPWTGYGYEVGAYDEKGIVYDANGNIKALKRYTQQTAGGAPELIDDLFMDYGSDAPTWLGAPANSGNRLLGATDSQGDPRGFKNTTTTAWNSYAYDANGSMTHDGNKGVYYTYNALNKVERQTVGSGSIATDYDASGTVVRKVTTTATTKTEYYIDGLVYEYSPAFAGLRSVPTPEGRAVAVQQSDAKLTYEYHLRDHLGNLRVAFRAQVGTEDLYLSSEDPNSEEGPYPKFENVRATQHFDMRTYSGYYNASVTKSQPGPAIGVPVSHGDHLQVRVFYQTPNGVQTSLLPPAPAAVAAALPTVSVVLAPALLPPPSAPAPDGRPTPSVVPGLQLSVSGLLGALMAKRHPAPRATTNALFGGNAPLGTFDAYLKWTLSNAEGEVVQSGSGSLAVPVYADRQWHQLDLPLDIDLSSEDARTGTLRLQEVNDATLPVYFDALTVTHPQDQAVVSQENHYYPFGMALSGVAVNTTAQPQVSKDQFNGGSELQDELLGSEQGIYSTFYRNYDPATGRFQGVDPLADTYADSSPYAFGFNDPVNFNDPNGDDPPQTYREAVNLMYGEGWYEQNGRGGSNAAFYGSSAFGPGMGTYLPGTSIGPTISSNESYRVALAANINPSYTASGALSISPLFVLNFYTDKGKLNSSVYYPWTFQVFGHNQVNDDPNYKVWSQGGNSYQPGTGFIVSNAVAALNQNALPGSIGKCATFVRLALQAGGINTSVHPLSAKDYGPYLTRWGFHGVTSNIKSDNYTLMRGDITVFNGYGTNHHGAWNGHIEMYNGNQWISDFKQNYFTPGPGYRQPPVPYTIYRW